MLWWHRCGSRGLDVSAITSVASTTTFPFDSEAYVTDLARASGRSGDAILFLDTRERRFPLRFGAHGGQADGR